MASKAQDIRESIVKAMYKVASKLDDRLMFNRTVRCHVTASVGDGIYTVKINGKEYNAKSHSTHTVGDVVWVIVCNNDMNDLIIIY